MPTIRLQGQEIPYDEADIITFDEGLIGMPHLRRMVCVRQNDIEPFLWLASLDDASVAFLVVDPRSLFERYAPATPADVRVSLGHKGDAPLLTLAIVLIAADWQRSTVNLRAPLIVSAASMRGVQTVLTESAYRADEPLPLQLAA